MPIHPRRVLLLRVRASHHALLRAETRNRLHLRHASHHAPKVPGGHLRRRGVQLVQVHLRRRGGTERAEPAAAAHRRRRRRRGHVQAEQVRRRGLRGGGWRI